MQVYEIWGPGDDELEICLGSRSGPVPKRGDTIDVNGKERTVKRVTDHHGAKGTTKRVHVGPEDEGGPMPVLFG